MLLQVHDELVFEVPEGEVEDVRRRVRDAMEGVATLKVPLVVETGAAATWDQSHS
jgi:DNA polymerase-1